MQTSLTLIDSDLVARLERQWRIAIREEERAIARDASEATLDRCVRASDRARRNLDCALRGQPLPVRTAPPTQRNRGKAGLAALARLGRVVARSVARLAALAKARAAAVLARLAKKARQAFRRALRAVVSLIAPNVTKEVPVSNPPVLAAGIVYGTISATIRVTDRYGNQHTLSREGRGLTVTCKLIGDRFVFSGGLRGEHCIDASAPITDATRLLAHWEGYCANNGLLPWEVTRISATGEAWYRYAVEGYNWYSQQPFSWRLQNLDDERFDLSRIAPEHLAQLGLHAQACKAVAS